MTKSSVTKAKRGGPQTEEGKKIASRNALKTGAYSNTLILPGEDEGKYRQIEEQFIHDFDPRDMAEIAMVKDLAILAWKKVRLENLELRFTLDRLARPLGFSETQDFPVLVSNEAIRYLRSPSDYSPQYQEDLEQAVLCTGKMLQALSVQELTEGELEDIKINCPMLWQNLINEIEDARYINPTAANVLRYTICNEAGDEQSFLEDVFQRALVFFQSELRVYQLVGEIDKQTQALQDRRLMALMENANSSRAFEDLRRNFYRTLTELRKHQEWRGKMQATSLAIQSKTIDEGAKE